MARAFTVLILTVCVATFWCGDNDDTDRMVDATPTVVVRDTPTIAPTDAFATDTTSPTATPTAAPTPTVTPTATATPIPESCGDGMPETDFDMSEECDDGNMRDGDGCSATCLIEPAVHDFSRFDTFEFRRQPALGFCAPEDEVFDAVITRTGSIFTLTGSILRDARSCEGLGGCADREEVMRVLTTDEAAALTEAFRAVEFLAAMPSWCERIAVDPCVIDAFSWDGLRVTDYPCSDSSMRFDETTRLVDALNELVHP